jgi:hypothetical protein
VNAFPQFEHLIIPGMSKFEGFDGVGRAEVPDRAIVLVDADSFVGSSSSEAFEDTCVGGVEGIVRRLSLTGVWVWIELVDDTDDVRSGALVI